LVAPSEILLRIAERPVESQRVSGESKVG